MICFGKVYRVDEVDASHNPMFHQLEGLLVDKSVTFSDLKGTLAVFARELFGRNRKVVFRPSYFPFTEPSAEVDVECIFCAGAGCRVCKKSGFIEIMGAGMVNPKVIENCGHDSSLYNGFAFGMGIDRIALLAYDIDDIRHLFTNDMRFLEQF
jgi:phenylalanyl-tRNA synthetase alpha chain